MKPNDPVAVPPPGASGRRNTRPARRPPQDAGQTEEQAFYAAQEEAFSDLRARHAARPRRKR